MLAARDGATAARAALAESASETEAQMDAELYRGLATDLAAVRRGLTWATALRKVRRGYDQPLSETQVKTLGSVRPTENLAGAFAAWEKARAAIVSAFAADRHEELEDELDLAATAASLIDELEDDSSGQQEWLGYQRATADLEAAGLDISGALLRRSSPRRERRPGSCRTSCPEFVRGRGLGLGPFTHASAGS